MSSSKITRYDMDESVFDGVAQESSIQEVLSDIEEINTNIDSIKEMLSSNGSSDEMTLSNDELVLASVLLRGDTDDYEWVLRQKGIGKVLNSVYNLDSDALASCSTISEIIVSEDALSALESNVEVATLCYYNSTLYSVIGARSNDPEVILTSGNGYNRYSVNDTFNLQFNGESIQFRVLAKDYKTKNKIVISPTIIVAESQWNADDNNNYEVSTLREYLNDTILNGFSERIKHAIVITPVSCHNQATSVICNDKIWALSYTELGCGTSGSHISSAEGSAFSYFNSASRRIMKYNSNAYTYWTRTPWSDYMNRSWAIDTSGNAITNANSVHINTTYGVVFAFEI